MNVGSGGAMNVGSGGAMKRVVDAAVAAVALVVLLPVYVVVAAVVAVGLGRPVLFRQERTGLGGLPFTLVKFRTMRDPDPARGLVSDADRLTALGRLLRSTSLDELPSLWNVLCGSMSLVGPRPLPVRYLARYTAEQARRHEVRPGITGLAQVRGRNRLGWAERFALDVSYVDSRSAWMDLRIVAETFAVVVRRSGITALGDATAPEFTGIATHHAGAIHAGSVDAGSHRRSSIPVGSHRGGSVRGGSHHAGLTHVGRHRRRPAPTLRRAGA